ncbi:MAG: hypothetical protein QOJ89_3968 [bacterium]
MNRRAWLLMAILAALWGASYLFIKVALDDGVPPVFVVWSRIALGAAVLVAIALRSGVLDGVRGYLPQIAFMALVQVVGPFLLITLGERDIASSLAGILVASAPIFTALLAVWVDQSERLRGIGLLGIFVGIVGVALLFGIDLSTDTKTLVGGLMVLLASLGYAIGTHYLKLRLRSVPPLTIAASTMIASAIVLLPLMAFNLPSQTPSLDAVGSLILLGAGGTGIAFAIFYTLIADVGPTRASLVAYIAPGFAVIYGVTLLDEPLTVGGIVGLVLILAGSWLAAEGRVPGRARIEPVAPLDPPGPGAVEPELVSRNGPSRSSAPEPAHAPRSPDASSRL